MSLDSLSLKPASVSPNHVHSRVVVFQPPSRGKGINFICLLKHFMLLFPNCIPPSSHILLPPHFSPLGPTPLPPPLLLYRLRRPLVHALLLPLPTIVRPGPPPPSLPACALSSPQGPPMNLIYLRLPATISDSEPSLTSLPTDYCPTD